MITKSIGFFPLFPKKYEKRILNISYVVHLIDNLLQKYIQLISFFFISSRNYYYD
jgi:hypothetical protein